MFVESPHTPVSGHTSVRTPQCPETPVSEHTSVWTHQCLDTEQAALFSAVLCSAESIWRRPCYYVASESLNHDVANKYGGSGDVAPHIFAFGR